MTRPRPGLWGIETKDSICFHWVSCSPASETGRARACLCYNQGATTRSRGGRRRKKCDLRDVGKFSSLPEKRLINLGDKIRSLSKRENCHPMWTNRVSRWIKKSSLWRMVSRFRSALSFRFRWDPPHTPFFFYFYSILIFQVWRQKLISFLANWQIFQFWPPRLTRCRKKMSQGSRVSNNHQRVTMTASCQYFWRSTTTFLGLENFSIQIVLAIPFPHFWFLPLQLIPKSYSNSWNMIFNTFTHIGWGCCWWLPHIG